MGRPRFGAAFFWGEEVPGELKGRVEVSGEPIRELSMKFLPDAPVITIPAWNYNKSCEYIGMRMYAVGHAGTYTFDGYRSIITLDYAERSGTSGPLTISAEIDHKTPQQLVDDGFAYFSSGSCIYKSDLPDSPGVYHHLVMTVDFHVPDPTLPPGTQIFPEKGLGVHTFHIEITNM